MRTKGAFYWLSFTSSVFVLVTALMMTLPESCRAISQATSAKPAPGLDEAINVSDDKDTSQLIAALDKSLQIYKEQADAETWGAAWQNFKALVWSCIVKHADCEAIIRSTASLKDIGLRLTAGANVKIWSFPRVTDCQQILVDWKETSYPKRPAVVGKRSKARFRKPLSPVVVTKIQAASCPANTQIDDARLIYLDRQGDVEGKSSKSEVGSILVLAGSSVKTGLMFLAGYRLYQGTWVPYPEVFSEIPPYLAQNLLGKASFSGTNLVLTVQDAKSKSPNGQETAGGLERPSIAQSGGYKITFRLFENHYVLDNRLSVDFAADPAAAIAVQFAQAVQNGRIDLVKAWLSDAQLASLPGYLGLYNKQSPAFKLVRMTTQGGATRFRLVTFGKDDLILDIGKNKNQWLIKGLFIAPVDPLAKTLAGISIKD